MENTTRFQFRRRKMQNNLQNLLKLQRRIKQLEQDLFVSEKSRNELIDLLKQRHATNAIFTLQGQNNQYDTQIKDLQSQIDFLRQENSDLQGQYFEMQTLNESQAQTISQFHERLKSLIQNAKGLQNLNIDLKNKLAAVEQEKAKLEQQMAEDKMVTQQLINVQAALADENDTLKQQISELSQKLGHNGAQTQLSRHASPQKLTTQTLPINQGNIQNIQQNLTGSQQDYENVDYQDNTSKISPQINQIFNIDGQNINQQSPQQQQIPDLTNLTIFQQTLPSQSSNLVQNHQIPQANTFLPNNLTINQQPALIQSTSQANSIENLQKRLDGLKQFKTQDIQPEVDLNDVSIQELSMPVPGSVNSASTRDRQLIEQELRNLTELRDEMMKIET